MAEAIRQHHRYAERRGSQTPEGNAKLFHTMQLLVATCGDRPMLGSVTKPDSAVTGQDVLAGVVLHPYRLLDIGHNYITFMQTDNGKTVKVVPRYLQYRAVCRTVEHLTTGKTRKQDGHQDRRGGIIWHTQGSGKSLTSWSTRRPTR